MTYAGIEAFLAVSRYQNISKAAAELYVSQSSLSIRLKNLENELGCTLFVRHKGSHEIALTEEGRRFYQLSLQYQEIVRKMLAVGKKEEILRVSAINSVATYLLPPVYERFMKENPSIHLEFQDLTAKAACEKLLQGGTDLAFTTDLPDMEQINAKVVLDEPMELVCALESCYPKNIEKGMLPVEHEVYVEWSSEYASWHRDFFGSDAVPQVRLEIMGQLQMFAVKKDAWAIVPRSVAEGLASADLRQLEPLYQIPKRKIYVLQRSMSDIAASCMFLDIVCQVWQHNFQLRH